jgi:AcrR family transcriptional regulator
MNGDRRGTREQILRAARRVLVRDGSDNLTIASVAAEAGLSVGGLRYHFASKRDLLEGLVSAMADAFDAALAGAGEGPGAKTRAYIAATLDATHSSDGADDTIVGVLAAAAVDTALLDSMRQRFVRWQAVIADDGIDPATATVVRLAIDGWWFVAVLDLAPPSPALAAQTRAVLERLIAAALP